MKDWKIGTRIRAGFGCVLALMLMMGGFLYLKMDEVDASARIVAKESLPGVYYSGQMQILTAQRFSYLYQHITSNDRAEMARLEARMAEAGEKMNETMRQYEATVNSDEDRKLLENVRTSRAAYTQTWGDVLEVSRQQKNEEAARMAREKVEPAYQALLRALDAVQQNNRKAADASSAMILSASASGIRTLLIVLTLALVLGGVISYMVAKSLVDPITRTVDLVSQVSRGDVSRQVNVESKDEMGVLQELMNKMIVAMQQRAEAARRLARGDMNVEVQVLSEVDSLGQSLEQMLESLRERERLVVDLAAGDLTRKVEVLSDRDSLGQSLDRMVSSLRQRAEVAQALSSGDLTVSVQVLSDRDVLGQAMDKMLENLRRTVAEVSSAADNVAAGSQQLSSSAQVLSEGANEQSSAAEESTTSMEEMASSIQQNADNARQTDKIATKAADDTRESGVAVTRTMEAMKEISSKITIIEEIARKTDLLALNAALEAARAGEHGKGFAVVASEVRKLAERSQLAAAEISGLTVEGVRLAEGAGDMLGKLVPDIRKTAELVREIAASCNEQSVGAAQVNKAMQQLDQVIQQNASASEEIASTSEELSSQAESLQSVISFFRLGNNGRALSQPARARRPLPPRARATKPSSREQLSSLGNAVRSEGVTLSLGATSSAVDQQDREFESY